MTSKLIVLVTDRGDPKHGEIVVLDSAAEAERLVETFLEAGYEKERVRVFSGAEMEAHVSQRPKVELVQTGDELPPAYTSEEREPAPAEVYQGGDAAPAPALGDDGAFAGEPQPAEAIGEAPEDEDWRTARPRLARLFGRPPAKRFEKSSEMMPELLH